MARKFTTRITAADMAIDYLGGTLEVAWLFEPPLDPRVVSNWRLPSRGLPPDTYVVMAPALQARGAVFSPALFNQRMPRPPHSGRRKRQSKAPSPTP